MRSANMRNKGQVYSVGNYVMNGKVLGKGHFARVEEATHRIIGKKVAIKIIDLTSIREEYARRNLHREPKVMAKLRHPCIAALYETMMNGPRLYMVMEAAGGGNLSAHVLSARVPARGLPEQRARALAGQLVSAVRHMHARGVVHRDLKMENIMLDTSKQFIKIVDFGLSNVWSTGGALHTPCGSLEYAAPELFVDGRRYGPEVDLWSIGVIVYGMVTGSLPFTSAETGEGRSRTQLRASITRGFARKQRAALACVSPECKTFIQHLLEPKVEERMKIDEAARHRWIKRPGMRMKTHPFGTTEPQTNRDIYRQISELCSIPIMDVVAQIRAEPFGPIAGMYNVKIHLHQLQSVGTDLLWSTAEEVRPPSPPEYKLNENSNGTKTPTPPANLHSIRSPSVPRTMESPLKINGVTRIVTNINQSSQISSLHHAKTVQQVARICDRLKKTELQSPRTLHRPMTNVYTVKKPGYRPYENGDCLDPRLPRIEEHSADDKRRLRVPCFRKVEEDRQLRLGSCPPRMGDKRADFYRKGGDGLPRNIVSPHSTASNSHCKSERGMPVGWYSTRSVSKEAGHLQRLRRTAPMK